MKYYIIAFLVGSLSYFKFDLIGRLNLGEAVLFFFLIAGLPNITSSSMWRERLFRQVITLAFLYLLGLIISDIYRGSELNDLIRGWAKISVTILTIVGFATGVPRDRMGATLGFYLLGVFSTLILSLELEGAKTDVYKFYIGVPVGLCSFLISGAAASLLRYSAFMLPTATAFIALSNDCRSLAAAQLMAIVLILWARFSLQGRSDRSLGRSGSTNTLRFLLVAAIASISVYGIYTTMAARGLLGQTVQDKFELQSSLSESGRFSIASARSELYFSLPKILSSPIIGFGSWAKDWEYVLSRGAELGWTPAQLAAVVGSESASSIPSHSHFFGGWLEAGLFGAVYWGYIVWLAVLVLLKLMQRRNQTSSHAAIFVVVLFIWDILFSPYGAERRVTNGIIIAWMMVTVMSVKVNAKRMER